MKKAGKTAAPFRIGIDLGGTKIEGLVLGEGDRELFRKRVPTEREKGYEHILGNIERLYRELAAHAGAAPHTLGIGTPGSLSVRTGLLKGSNTVCMNGQPVKQDLERRLGRPLAMQNDANCFALAEALDGAGRGRDMVFGVIIGTGCGGGLVYKGQVWTGLQAIGGEWGHMSIDPHGPVCYCGTPGCVETFISGGGLERRWQHLHGEHRRIADVVEDYRRGEPRATDFMREFFGNFGRAIANLINVLDPDIVVLGGGMSKTDEIYTEGVAEVAKRVFSDSLETPIVRHQLGDSAGVIGAALVGV
jgi:fructokinase